jgi:hypothetical protein
MLVLKAGLVAQAATLAHTVEIIGKRSTIEFPFAVGGSFHDPGASADDFRRIAQS